MIQFKRGSTESWKKLKKPLAAGQPGYDKDKHKIKVGDGTKLWDKLPYVSISEEEVLDSEKNARARLAQDPESLTIMTYGTESPDKNTVGKLYLQYYEAEPEADYIVSAGIDDGWSYQKWKSGIARCFKTFNFTTTIQTAIGTAGLYKNSTEIGELKYPFNFIVKNNKLYPSESVSISSPGGIVWIAAGKGLNTTKHSASYSIISPDKLTNNITYKITIKVEGFWR